MGAVGGGSGLGGGGPAVVGRLDDRPQVLAPTYIY